MKSTEGGACPGYSQLVDISEYQIYPEPMPEFTDIPETESGDCTECPPTVFETLVITPDITEDGEKIPTDMECDEPPSAQSINTFAAAGWIVAAALIPTILLGAVIVIILKRR